MAKTVLEKLVLRGCEFIHIAADGTETVVFTAASEEAAKAINNMLGVSKEPKYQKCAVQLDKQTVDFCYDKFIELCLRTFLK